MAWYDLDTNKESKQEYIARIKYKEIVCKKAANFKDIIGVDLLENVQYRFTTTNSFNAITVIEYLVENHKILEFYIAIYRMNQQAVNYLSRLVKTKKITGQIIVSSFFRENKRYEKWANDLVLLNSDRIKISFAWNHAKVLLIKTKCGKHIVFEGSGNLSDNARIEQYLIEDNKNSYDFHKNWITEL